MMYLKTAFALILFSCFSIGLVACKTLQTDESLSLKDALSGKFYIGTAMNSEQITGIDAASVRVIKDQFNAIVPENVMKSEVIQPVEGEFNFTLADQFVDFGEKNKLFVTGHTLIWHSQLPKWFCVDDK